jgi:quaternary ammonium compound-resistance protein SugE
MIPLLTLTKNQSWGLLIVSGLFEIFWAIGLKYSDGFTKLGPSLFTLFTLILGMALLSLASKNLPIGSAYSVWVGIGSLGTCVLGIFLFKESISHLKLFFLALLLQLLGSKQARSKRDVVISSIR